MRQTIPTLLLATSLCLFAPPPTPAQDSPTGPSPTLNQDASTETQTRTVLRRGLYLSMEGGANLAQSMETNLTGPLGRPEEWRNRFGQVQGVLAGAGLGYQWLLPRPADGQGAENYLGFELEYFYRSKHSQTSDACIAETNCSGDTTVEEYIGKLESHNLFLNFYLTPWGIFADHFMGRFYEPATSILRYIQKNASPYSGIGFGLSFLNMDYENGAMSPTATADTLDDMLLGYQALFGLDYPLGDNCSIGVKGRWTYFVDFRDDGIWKSSNSSQSNESDSYRFETKDLDMFGVSMNFKYHF